MKAVILAAGEGTRMRPITDEKPKPMVRIHGTPLLHHLLSRLKEVGVEDFVFVVGYKKEKIIQYFSDLDFQIDYVEQEKRLGMAHAAIQTKELVSDKFLLTAADSLYTPEHYRRMIENSDSVDLVLSLREIEREKIEDTLSSVLMESNEVKKIIEKPSNPSTNISSGPAFILPPSIFEYIDQISMSERGEYEIQDAINLMLEDGYGTTGVFADIWYHLTEPKDIKRLERALDKNTIG